MAKKKKREFDLTIPSDFIDAIAETLGPKDKERFFKQIKDQDEREVKEIIKQYNEEIHYQKYFRFKILRWSKKALDWFVDFFYLWIVLLLIGVFAWNKFF